MAFYLRKKKPSANQHAASSSITVAPLSLGITDGPSAALTQQQRHQARSDSPSITLQLPEPQQRPAYGYPWSVQRLLRHPPISTPKPGVAAPPLPSPSPFPRFGHALSATASASGGLYIFGSLICETARNGLYLFSPHHMSATLVQTYAEIPSPRVGHASAIFSNILIVWGGDTKTDPWSDQPHQ
ncbi:hypothetical protein DFH29DRAFT_1042649 [Suillus ampliporus]|nr:hypothetical protein DFH29DRAFT_1042649 [Suillus ampliporus]